jgi:hypothetical protein
MEKHGKESDKSERESSFISDSWNFCLAITKAEGTCLPLCMVGETLRDFVVGVK